MPGVIVASPPEPPPIDIQLPDGSIIIVGSDDSIESFMQDINGQGLFLGQAQYVTVYTLRHVGPDATTNSIHSGTGSSTSNMALVTVNFETTLINALGFDVFDSKTICIPCIINAILRLSNLL